MCPSSFFRMVWYNFGFLICPISSFIHWKTSNLARTNQDRIFYMPKCIKRNTPLAEIIRMSRMYKMPQLFEKLQRANRVWTEQQQHKQQINRQNRIAEQNKRSTATRLKMGNKKCTRIWERTVISESDCNATFDLRRD